MCNWVSRLQEYKRLTYCPFHFVKPSLRSSVHPSTITQDVEENRLVKYHRKKNSTLLEGISFTCHTVRRKDRVRLQLVHFTVHSTLLVVDFLACGLRSSCHPEGNIFHHVSPICFTAGDVASI